MKQILIILFFFASLSLAAQERTDATDQDEELGKISWYRSYQVALEQSALKNKPVLILFQEVPGCATCRNYGLNVLSHPLMIKAVENEFIPLAILK